MTGIKQIDVLAQASAQSGSIGGILEVRLDAPDGKLLGQSDSVSSKPMNFARLIENGGGKGKGGDKPGGKGNAKGGPQNKGQQPPKFDPSKFDFNMLRKMMASHNLVNVPTIEGKHTLYIIAKNPAAGQNKVLMQLAEVQFRNSVAPPPPPMGN
jgi:cytochrome c